ncbi:hypothetical protein NMG60_11034547 [Bertholletia excelsa]
MAIRFRRLRDFSRVLPRIYSVTFRFSTVLGTSHESLPEDDLSSFIESTLDDLEGPHHCWLNKEEGKHFSKSGVFLVLIGTFADSSTLGFYPAVMFEKVKALQRRYPTLNVIGFQPNSSILSETVRTCLIEIAMKEFITFPILLSSKDFAEMTDRSCFLVFKGSKSPFLWYEKDVDLGIMDRVIKELVQQSENHMPMTNPKSTWVKQIEFIKEPYACSFLRNLLLYFPGCISVDERGNRLFLSDINHHRIIIFDSNGKIVDCIGSAPGFEDGEFESAKLMRPAALFYHAIEDCLYIVDSENHAVRRADMERRVLETLYPTYNANKRVSSLWSWIVNKLGIQRDDNTKLEDVNAVPFLFPWHLIKSSDNDLIIFDRSFETLWVMDLASGVIKETIKGCPRISELFGEMMLEKSSLLKQIPGDWDPYASLLSSLATIQDHVVICDTAGQRLLKFNQESGLISTFNFSNFGILGLPYWLSFPLERVYDVDDAMSRVHIDHAESFSLLPGRVEIQLNIEIPEDVELVEPLQEGCVWRQARGAATEASGAENKEASIEKVGVAQQWYDELDNLAFATPEAELSAEEENISCENTEEGLCIDCAVHTSPGTSEVIIFAALYLRLKRNPDKKSDDEEEKNAARIVDILNPRIDERMGREQCIQFLKKSNRDPGELIFIKPLHVRLNFDTHDHPKADNSKDIILTDSSIEVNVSL